MLALLYWKRLKYMFCHTSVMIKFPFSLTASVFKKWSFCFLRRRCVVMECWELQIHYGERSLYAFSKMTSILRGKDHITMGRFLYTIQTRSHVISENIYVDIEWWWDFFCCRKGLIPIHRVTSHDRLNHFMYTKDQRWCFDDMAHPILQHSSLENHQLISLLTSVLHLVRLSKQ